MEWLGNGATHGASPFPDEEAGGDPVSTMRGSSTAYPYQQSTSSHLSDRVMASHLGDAAMASLCQSQQRCVKASIVSSWSLAETQDQLCSLGVHGSESLEQERARTLVCPTELTHTEEEWRRKESMLGAQDPSRSSPILGAVGSWDVFDKSIINVQNKSVEMDQDKSKTFITKYEQELRHFGMLRRWDDSQRFLSDLPQLICEETANHLILWCFRLQQEGKEALMEQVAHQAVVMQFILEMASNSQQDPRGCFRHFFHKAKEEPAPQTPEMSLEEEALLPLTEETDSEIAAPIPEMEEKDSFILHERAFIASSLARPLSPAPRPWEDEPMEEKAAAFHQLKAAVKQQLRDLKEARTQTAPCCITQLPSRKRCREETSADQPAKRLKSQEEQAPHTCEMSLEEEEEVAPLPLVVKEEEHCQPSSETLPSGVEDVDKQDADKPAYCSEYAQDTCTYLRLLEVQQAVEPDYLQGSDITESMRDLLVDWMMQAHSTFHLLQETLYAMIAIVDRFLEVHPVSPGDLHLVGVTALLLAWKYEEDRGPGPAFFQFNDLHPKKKILEMEQVILRSLNFDLGRPAPLHFLRRASKVGHADFQTHVLAKYFLELTLLDYKMVHYCPSEVAAASLCLSQMLLHDLLWSQTQQHYSAYDQAHLKPIMQQIARNVVTANEGARKFTAVKAKYSADNISLLPQLSASVIRNMADSLLHP